jgi:hypothetical protein
MSFLHCRYWWTRSAPIVGITGTYRKVPLFWFIRVSNRLQQYSRLYLLTPWSRVLLEKLTDLKLSKKFPSLYGTRRFITAFTSARQLSLSLASSIQFIPPTSHFLNICLNIILPSTPGITRWSLSLRFSHQNPVRASPLPHTRYMPCLFYTSRFNHPHSSGWGIQIIKLLIMEFSPLPRYLVPA